MAAEYGVRYKPRRGPARVAAAALIALTLGGLILVWATDRARRIAVTRAWTVTGPACAIATRLPADPSDAPTQKVTYYGIGFARAHGAIRCAEIYYDGGRSGDDFQVCQFDHPGRLLVTTPRGSTRFDLGPLSPATVSIEHDVPHCVVGQSQDVDREVGLGEAAGAP